MVHPKAIRDAVAAAAKRKFTGEEARKVKYITDQLRRGVDGDDRPIREPADADMLKDSLVILIRQHDRSQKEATNA